MMEETEGIVIRLREYNSVDQNTDLAKLLLEAADHIEMLNRRANRWQESAERFAESDPKHAAFAFYFRALRDA
jgi:hypothetical protein